METQLTNCYNIVVDMLRKHGVTYRKKHGNHIVVQGENKFISLDTWNGYINIVDGIFDGGMYSLTFDKGEFMAGKPHGDVLTTKEKIGRAYQFILKQI